MGFIPGSSLKKIISGSGQGTTVVPGIKLRSAACKASILKTL